MTKTNLDTLLSLVDENKVLKSELDNLQSDYNELDLRLNRLYSSKSFKLWQWFNKIKIKLKK